MKSNKLAEKTKEVFEKQREINDIIHELRDEVKEVYNENIRLQKENEELKQQLLSSVKVKEEIVAKEEVVKEQPVVEEKVVKKVEPVQPVKKVAVTTKKVTGFQLRNTALAEFFLGKNIIAKLASVFIFLGIVTFGQLAYVKWLGDVGRVALILFTGLVFGVVAYLAERRKIVVFSNVFYAISVGILFYSNVLASKQFNLYSETIFSYISIAIVVLVFIYFYRKRYPFLDSMLFVFYMIVGVFSIIYNQDIGSVSSYFEQVLTVTLLTGVSYYYFEKYYTSNLKMKMILVSTFLIGNYVMFMSMYELQIFSNSSPYTHPGYFYLLHGLYPVVIMYLISLRYKGDVLDRREYIVAGVTVLQILLSSGMVSAGLGILFVLNTSSFGWFIFALLFVPLYVILYKRKEVLPKSIANIFIVSIAFGLVMYSFFGSSFTRDRLFSTEIANLVLALSVLAFYVTYLFTKDQILKYTGFIAMVIFLFRQLGYNLFSSTYLFEDIWVGLIGFLLFVFMLSATYIYRGYTKEINQESNTVLHTITAFITIPVVVTLTNELLSNDSAYIMGMVLLGLIGYRWLIQIPFFDVENKKRVKGVIHIAVIILLIVLNMTYFDHDFTKFDDVLKFLILFTYNVYLVYILRETFMDFVGEKDRETYFVVYYIFGVILHSLFIHNYINFEFDRVILSSYFLIASAIAVLVGFRYQYSLVRKIGLGAIYLSLAKIFIYDLLNQDMETYVRMITYFILGFVLLGISILYSYLERTYGNQDAEESV